MSNKITMKVAEFVELYNSTNINQITRHDVYRMIKNGEMNAHKGKRGAWIIELEEKKEKPVKEYTIKEFVEKYNRYHLDNIITIDKVRKLASDGKINAKKVSGKWVILEHPRKKIRV